MIQCNSEGGRWHKRQEVYGGVGDVGDEDDCEVQKGNYQRYQAAEPPCRSRLRKEGGQHEGQHFLWNLFVKLQ